MTIAYPFDADALMAQARASTGLADFGPDHFIAPLGRLLASINAEAQLNEAGVQMQGGRILNALENRLRRQALMQRHPEIADQRVDVAAIIVGMPRTGSTMLQRLLASSPRAFRNWKTARRSVRSRRAICAAAISSSPVSCAIRCCPKAR